jgi:hypoxanthine phosphoribosyltransferase
LAYLLRWLHGKGARAEICTLLDRQAARVTEVQIRYRGFEAPNEILVGFGLRLYRRFQELPFIAVLDGPPGEADLVAP